MSNYLLLCLKSKPLGMSFYVRILSISLSSLKKIVAKVHGCRHKPLKRTVRKTTEDQNPGDQKQIKTIIKKYKQHDLKSTS